MTWRTFFSRPRHRWSYFVLGTLVCNQITLYHWPHEEVNQLLVQYAMLPLNVIAMAWICEKGSRLSVGRWFRMQRREVDRAHARCIRAIDEARAAMREHDERGEEWKRGSNA